MEISRAQQAAFADFIAPKPGETPLARRGQPGDRASRDSAGPRTVTALDNSESSGALVTAADLQETASDETSARDRPPGGRIDVTA